VVIGVVRDIEARASTNRFPDLAMERLLLIDVLEAFPADPGRTILVDQAGPEWPGGGQPVVKGDRVLVTLLRRPADYSWACGRLRPCNGPAPAVNWVGVEFYRPANWP
jgi:hypothetical protein